MTHGGVRAVAALCEVVARRAGRVLVAREKRFVNRAYENHWVPAARAKSQVIDSLTKTRSLGSLEELRGYAELVNRLLGACD